MTDTSTLLKSIEGISSRVGDDMSEQDVENAFLNENFFQTLGYKGAGYDLRSEFTLPDNKRPDYVTLDNNEAVTAVYEFKQTGRNLAEHEDQLFDYMKTLRSDYGVLTNGEMFRLYRRGKDRHTLQVSFESITETEARDLFDALQKREFDLTDPDDVNGFLEELDPIPLDEEAELGQEHFFDTFRLEEGSPFADLVTGMMDVLHELRDEEKAKFVRGAYDFWEATYADEPDEVPNSWEPFINGKQSLRDFMFCLESGHALLSRLLLAKATEDHDFFKGTGYNGMQEYFRGLQGFDGTINLDSFPVAADNMIDDMQDKLVEGLFQDDIFVWWTDGYAEQLARGHETGASQFREVAMGTGSVERISDATRDRFSRAVAEVFFNVLRFDFSDVEGDLLGDLYQRYFDPETRKALGEFYTPQPVVDYIMDGVGYERGVSNERLIDPACGSGTFLVEAVERYIEDVERYEDDPDWEEHLRDLCTRPRIVGLDIHPFAVLMAQIRFVVAILPAYRRAKERNPEFTLRRLPIYRTDTLRNERELTGADLGDDSAKQMTWDSLTEDEQDVRIPVPLPVEVNGEEGVETEDGFLVRRVRMPLFDTIRLDTGVSNFGEYFAALQGVLDTVKDHMALAEEFGEDFDWTYKSGLEERVNEHTSQEYTGVEEFFEPYVDDMLENVRYLKEEHNDGRLFKMFEDTVLALVVKNYMEYDYVVGNPPYVRVQYLSDNQKEYMDILYDSAMGNYDLYCLFTERGIDMLEDGGSLGYILPNQFMNTDYGEGMRSKILETTTIEEVYDFRNSGVFEDAMNCPLILVLEKEEAEDVRQSNDIRSIRVKANVDEDSGKHVDEKIIEAVSQHRDEAGYEDEYIDVFDYPQKELDSGFWSIMPEDELEVFRKLENESDCLVGDITDSVFAGTQTGLNKVYVVTPIDTDIVESSEKGDTVTVVPSGGHEEYEIETDLLRPWLQGKDIRRWRGDWSGQHVILPYYVEENEQGEREAKVHTQSYLKENLPLTWDYLQEHKERLEEREGGKMKGKDDWYGFTYPKSHERFERPKIIAPAISMDARFMLDETGSWYFKTGYGIQSVEEYQEDTNIIASQLNSSVLNFYFKHIAALKISGAYEYRAQFVEKLPYVSTDENGRFDRISQVVDKIISTIDLSNKTDRFPEAYLGDYLGEMEYITYEWQTRRYPVNAEVQGNADGEFMVQAGRSDTINDPAMFSDDREARKRRAEYVQRAVDGRSVKSGEETTIPIPRSDEGVNEMLEVIEADREEVESTDIDALEAEIDKAVYDLFNLTDEEREVIEMYLEVF